MKIILGMAIGKFYFGLKQLNLDLWKLKVYFV